MVAQSGIRVKVGDPVAWVRYDDGLTQEFPLDRLRLAGFRHSVPWRQVRSRHGQAQYSGEVAGAPAWPGVLARRLGWDYVVWSGGDAVVLENVRFLAGYRGPGVVPADEVDRAWESVRDGEQLADAELRLAGGRPRHEARPALLALLWAGRLTTDLARPLSGESVLGRRPS